MMRRIDEPMIERFEVNGKTERRGYIRVGLDDHDEAIRQFSTALREEGANEPIRYSIASVVDGWELRPNYSRMTPDVAERAAARVIAAIPSARKLTTEEENASRKRGRQ